MSFDLIAQLSKRLHPHVEELIRLDSEAYSSRGREKREKEKQAESKRMEILAIDRDLSYHEVAAHREDSAVGLRSMWVSANRVVDIAEPAWSGWGEINAPKFNLSILPKYSFAAQFTFRLSRPYISRDEQEFYVIDNPVRKEKVFGLPYVAPSSWKGSLRSALWQLEYKEDNEQVQRIFGNKRAIEDEDKLRKGRLHFYPTFFTNKSLEVINPHDRERRVGSHPIYFESVPVDAKGVFSILYAPFGKSGPNELESKRQVAPDIKLIFEGLQSMFTIYGFGAKTSSGFGAAQPDLIDGKMVLKASMNSKHPQSKVARKQEWPTWTFKDFDELVKRGEEVRALLADNERAS